VHSEDIIHALAILAKDKEVDLERLIALARINNIGKTKNYYFKLEC
jgi:hypothetical protein